MNVLSRQLAFFAPAAVMSAWAVVMLHTFATGHLNRLLSPMFRNYVLVAAGVLLVLSILHLLLYQPNAITAPALAPTGRLRQLGRWLVLLIPLIAAAVLSPAALSSTTLNNRASSTGGAIPMPTWNAESQAKAKEVLEADPNQPVPVEVTDLITLAHSPGQAQAFEGRKVRVVGLMNSSASGAPKLVRWIMWCCAADAQPASVALSGHTAGTFKETDWLEVTGTAHFPATLGQAVPQIEVDSIQPTTEPDEPFLSP